LFIRDDRCEPAVGGDDQVAFLLQLSPDFTWASTHIADRNEYHWTPLGDLDYSDCSLAGATIEIAAGKRKTGWKPVGASLLVAGCRQCGTPLATDFQSVLHGPAAISIVAVVALVSH
jgi:hypothetical protein